MSTRFELRLAPELEGVSSLMPLGGWDNTNLFLVKLHCENCGLDTGLLKLSLERTVNKKKHEPLHISIQCRCKTIGKVKILNLLNGRPKKNGDIRVMLIECSNMHPLNEIVFEFKWIAFDEDGVGSDPFEFYPGVCPRFPNSRKTEDSRIVQNLRPYFHMK